MAAFWESHPRTAPLTHPHRLVCTGKRPTEQELSVTQKRGSGAKCGSFFVFLFCRRIPMEDIPEDEDKCSAWLHKLYQEKVGALGLRCHVMGGQLLVSPVSYMSSSKRT